MIPRQCMFLTLILLSLSLTIQLDCAEVAASDPMEQSDAGHAGIMVGRHLSGAVRKMPLDRVGASFLYDGGKHFLYSSGFHRIRFACDILQRYRTGLRRIGTRRPFSLRKEKKDPIKALKYRSFKDRKPESRPIRTTGDIAAASLS